MAGQVKIGAAMPVVPALSHGDGHTLAGHGSASSSICLLAWSPGARNVGVGSGGVYALSCSWPVVGVLDCAQPGGDPGLAGGDGLAVAPAVGPFGPVSAGPLDLAGVGVSGHSECGCGHTLGMRM